MIALIQRVSRASVTVDAAMIGAIERGILALIGIERGDTVSNGERLVRRLTAYRIFDDDEGKMNLSVTDIGGGMLLVPQFTLAADTRKGARPSFSSAAPPQLATDLFHDLVRRAQARHATVASGRFGADMQVELVNYGPVTFWLQA